MGVDVGAFAEEVTRRPVRESGSVREEPRESSKGEEGEDNEEDVVYPEADELVWVDFACTTGYEGTAYRCRAARVLGRRRSAPSSTRNECADVAAHFLDKRLDGVQHQASSKGLILAHYTM